MCPYQQSQGINHHGQKHCCHDSCQQHCCPQRCCHWQLCCSRDHYCCSTWLNLSLIITRTLHGTLRILLKDSFVPFWGLNGGIDPSENRVLNIRLPDMGLKGRFPLGLKHCTSITGIDLSSNELFGSIPQNISKIIQYATSLYLSSNNFSGEIPPGLANCTFLNVLKLNFSLEKCIDNPFISPWHTCSLGMYWLRRFWDSRFPCLRNQFLKWDRVTFWRLATTSTNSIVKIN